MVAGGSGLTDVLVVGAGPAGLTAALVAHDHGATVRIVERRSEAFRPSRAMVMHPRTLESLRPLGVTAALLDRGDTRPRGSLHVGGRRIDVGLAGLAMPETAFPHLTLLRQMDVEEVLAAALDARGVRIERGTELVGVAQDGGGVHATLRSESGADDVACRFLVGCDGPASTVRAAAGIGWSGGSYREAVVLADVELEGPLEPGGVHVAPGRTGLVFVFALGEGATWRVLATRPAAPGVPGAFGQPGREVPVSEVQRLLDDAGLPASVTGLAWSAEVPLQHRLAGSFRRGLIFLAGDAAHAHSPAAAQGMNTGILDAVNLGWKLGLASNAADHEVLLASYGLERRPVARRVLALTHAVFFAEASTHPLPSLLRGAVVPLAAPVLPALTRQPSLMAPVVRLLSQRWVRYRGSPLSVEGTPPGRAPRAGDQLPDEAVRYDGGETRLHELTARPGIHVLLDRDAVDPLLRGPHVVVHRLTSRAGRGVVAVRPDGHVGFRCGEADARQLAAWLRLVGAEPHGPK